MFGYPLRGGFMKILQTVLDYISRVPEWVFLYVVPAVITAAAIAFIFAPKRRWFFAVAAFIGSAGFLAVYAKSVSLSLVYSGLLVAYTALLSLLFFIPVPKRKKKGKREERLFEKFHEELSEKSYQRNVAMPPKVCCFEREETGGATAKEYGVSLSYADTLLKKLRSKKLKAGDRLETEELLRRLDCYREKPLDDGERSSLNDCLASILKLTAKYQL